MSGACESSENYFLNLPDVVREEIMEIVDDNLNLDNSTLWTISQDDNGTDIEVVFNYENENFQMNTTHVLSNIKKYTRTVEDENNWVSDTGEILTTLELKNYLNSLPSLYERVTTERSGRNADSRGE